MIIQDTVLERSYCTGGAGGLLLWNGTLSATNFTVRNATTKGSGGAIWATLGSAITCSGCTFEDNVARREGGAIKSMDQAPLTVCFNDLTTRTCRVHTC